MLDITLLRKDLDSVVTRLQTRKHPQPWLDVEAFSALEAERKMLQTRTEDLQAQRNSLSKQIGMLKGKGDHADADAVMAQVGGIKQTLEAAETRLKALQAEIEDILSGVPNLPHARSGRGRVQQHGQLPHQPAAAAANARARLGLGRVQQVQQAGRKGGGQLRLALGLLGVEGQLQHAATVPIDASVQVLQQASGVAETTEYQLRQGCAVGR